MAEGAARRGIPGRRALGRALRKLSRFLALHHREKALFLEAWLRLAWAQIAPPPRPRLESAAPARPPAVALERLERLFLLAERHHPGAVSCFPRSGALREFLARRGHPACVRVGVRRVEGGKLEGHAWTEVRGRAVGEGPRLGEFGALEPAASPSRP